MGSGRDKRRKPKHRRRPKVKTKQKLIAVLVVRPHKWTTLKNLAYAAGVNEAITDRIMVRLAAEGVIAMQTCAKWEGGWRYRPLPKCWPKDARIRDMLMSGVTERGIVAVAELAESVSERILGFAAPNTVKPIIWDMIRQGELRWKREDVRPYPHIPAFTIEEDLVSVPVDSWLKRIAREQARTGMVRRIKRSVANGAVEAAVGSA